MTDTEPEPSSAPIRVAEVTVAAYQWDAWREGAERGFRRAHRVAVVAAVVVGGALAAAGLALLPGDGKVSVAVYTPLAGWAAWAWLRGALSRRSAAAAVEQVRGLVVPALVDAAGGATLLVLLLRGGTLVTERSTTITVDRRDSLVALVASEYDLTDVPVIFPTSGVGP